MKTFTQVICAVVLGVMLPGLVASAAEENPAHSAAIQGFESDPEIRNEKKKLESAGLAPGPVQVIGLGGHCGVAGCDSTFLVAQILSSGPSSHGAQIFATVVVRSPGFSVQHVRRVTIEPFESSEGSK